MKIDRALLKASARSWVASDLTRVGPWWLQWVWTLLFAAGLAAVFTVLGFFVFNPRSTDLGSLDRWAFWYGKNFVVCAVISLLIHALFDGIGHLLGGPAALRRFSDTQRSLFFAGVPITGVIIGWPLGIWVSGSSELVFPVWNNLRSAAASVTLALSISLALHFWFAAKARQVAAEARATEAQLRLLQGQIEPHFLFNTLANVQSLMDHDPPKARQMLASFTDYLRASLSTLRRDDSAVAQELELARSYLELLQARMEDRLQFSIDADEAARSVPLPPLLLQPLVENAIVHGLEPSIDGGSVQVTARVHDGQLVLEVRDDGRGLEAAPPSARRSGAGLALQNIRERLQARYGSEATLRVEAAHPGTRARITLPLQTLAASAPC